MPKQVKISELAGNFVDFTSLRNDPNFIFVTPYPYELEFTFDLLNESESPTSVYRVEVRDSAGETIYSKKPAYRLESQGILPMQVSIGMDQPIRGDWTGELSISFIDGDVLTHALQVHKQK